MRVYGSSQTFCIDVVVLLVSSCLILRFFCIGCTIGGLVMKFSEPLLSLDGIVLLNNVSLGSLPFGSLLYTLDMCIVSSFVLDTVYVVLIFCGISKRSKGWLIASSAAIFLGIIFNIFIVAFYSWILDKIHTLIFTSLKARYDENQEKFETTLKCRRYMVWNGSSAITCSDYIKSTVYTYGSTFIAMLVSNIVLSIVILVGIECLFRYKNVREKLKHKSNMWTVTVKLELVNSENGMWNQSCLFLKNSWARNPTVSKLGYLSAGYIVVDFGFLLVLLLVRYDLNDLTSAEKLYAKTIDYFNEGYLQDGLLITMICLFVWSFIAKTFYFVGIYSNRKYYFAAFFCSELLCLIIHFVVVGFSGKLFVNEWTAFLAIFLSVSIVYIIFKIIYIYKADSVYRYTVQSTRFSDYPLLPGRYGFVRYVKHLIKEHNLTASLIVVSVMMCIVDCIQISGLLIIRYGYSPRHFVNQILNGIKLGTLKMSVNRDSVAFISLVSCILSFLLQCAKWISVGTKKPRIALFITWTEVPLLILQACGVSMDIILIKLLYCCDDNDGCFFSYGSKYRFCYGDVYDHMKIFAWFALVTGILNIFLQVSSVYFGFRYFKQSEDGHLGIFKGLTELFLDPWKKIRKDRTLEFIHVLQRIFYGLQLFSLVLNVAFWIGIVLMIFVPGYIYGNGLLKKLSDQPLSLSFNNAESTIIGILGSLMAFIYINVFNQIFGMRFLYQRKATFFRMFILIEVGFCMIDVIYLIFSSDVLHAAYCFCNYGSYCKNSFNSTEIERNEIISLVISKSLSKQLPLRIGPKDDSPKNKDGVRQQSTIQEVPQTSCSQILDDVIRNAEETLGMLQLSESLASNSKQLTNESEEESLENRNNAHIETLQTDDDNDDDIDDENDESDDKEEEDLFKTAYEMGFLSKEEYSEVE
ncbi:uncharacterized protein LOC128157153 isoform X3 [Crassostrea angulata]|uniref:uncharacterized protein LOC128157153 isoform X3 n=1 Tax=Magallana angulata TaxID=2784310 RepID=UPI0022B10C63|nr:uncharacterized protein LOC128157153 isoform X3 [Crassostrea angulata]